MGGFRAAARGGARGPAGATDRDEHLAAPLFRTHDRVEAAAADMKRDPAGFADGVTNACEELGMGVDEPPGAADASRLLVGEHGEDEVARRPAARLGAEHCADHHRTAALHVEGFSAPNVAVDDVAAQGTVA